MQPTRNPRFQEAQASLLEAAGKPALPAPYVDLSSAIHRARRERAKAISQLVGRFSAWLRARVREARQSDAERYLARATDLADLERRMQVLERRAGGAF